MRQLVFVALAVAATAIPAPARAAPYVGAALLLGAGSGTETGMIALGAQGTVSIEGPDQSATLTAVGLRTSVEFPAAGPVGFILCATLLSDFDTRVVDGDRLGGSLFLVGLGVRFGVGG